MLLACLAQNSHIVKEPTKSTINRDWWAAGGREEKTKKPRSCHLFCFLLQFERAVKIKLSFTFHSYFLMPTPLSVS